MEQRRYPAAPGDDSIPSRDHYISIHERTQQPGGKNGAPLDQYRPARCGNPTPIGGLLIADLGAAHEASARRELPPGTTSGSRRTRGGY